MSVQTILPPLPRRRGPALGKTIIVDGKPWKPRKELAQKVGCSDRTAQRISRDIVTYIAGCAYCQEEEFLRRLVERKEPQQPARTMRRGPYRR